MKTFDELEIRRPALAQTYLHLLESQAGRPLGPRGTVSATTLELADVILDEAKVAFVPGEAFGTPGYARFSFAMADADMGEGIRRIAAFVGA